MTATDIPQGLGTSTGATDAEAATQAPPIVSAPKDTPPHDDLSYFDEGDGMRPKKTGKVRVSCQSCPFISYRLCWNRDNRTI